MAMLPGLCLSLAGSVPLPGSPAQAQGRAAGAAGSGTTFHVRDFGAVCDGTADDTGPLTRFFAAINTAAKSTGSATGTIAGRCRIRSLGVQLASGVTLTGEGDATLVCADNTTRWCLVLAGGATRGDKVPVTANVALRSEVIPVASVAPFAAGDYVFILYSPVGDVKHSVQGQLNRVAAVEASSLKLAYPITFAIDRPANATVVKESMAANLVLTNLKLDGSEAAGAQNGLLVHNFVEARISGIESSNFTKYDPKSGLGQQMAVHIANCDRCLITDLVSRNASGHALYFRALTNSQLRNARVKDAGGAGIEYVYISSSRVADVKVDGARGRAVKLYGTTGTEFANIDLRGSLAWRSPDGKHFNYTGFSVSSASSHNTIHNLKVSQASSCVWLNGTGNNNNSFDRVVVSECVRPDRATGAPTKGVSVFIAATKPTTDANNTFRNVVGSARAQVLDQGQGTSIHYAD